MKKAIFCAGALMFGAFGFAQNTSTATSTGTGNLVHVDQTTAGGTNVSTISQEFTNNFADVDQVGTNRSLVDQQGANSAASGLGNKAIIDQNGGSSGKNRSTALQYGDDNYANAMQDGSNHFSKIKQGNLPGGAEDNWARVDQFGGDGNHADIEQLHDNNWGLATQDGNTNKIVMRQRSNPGSVAGNYSQISQVGDNNRATSKQTTINPTVSVPAFSNKEIVSQIGDWNKSKLVQEGDDNYSKVSQDDSNLGSGSAWNNRADVEQLNNMNTSRITQDGVATVTTNNYARVRQDGSIQNNTSTITQHGANTAYVNQNN
jgi:hypothetical protein